MEQTQGLGDVLDEGDVKLMRPGQRQQRLAQVPHHARLPLTLLDLILQGVQDRRIRAEPLRRQAAVELFF